MSVTKIVNEMQGLSVSQREKATFAILRFGFLKKS